MNIHKVPESEIPSFTVEGDVVHMEERGEWFFNRSMIGSCAPLFNNCQDNYQAEEKLREAGVITYREQTDSESSALWVYFDSRGQAESFIVRLNRYLRKRAHKLNEFIEQF
jgi:hypothetical protein